MATTIEELGKEIEQIKERNKKVEADKVWETSLARKTVIAVFTYLAIGLYLHAIHIPNPWLNGIVPTIGFLLSTLTFPFIKDIWLKHFYRKEQK